MADYAFMMRGSSEESRLYLRQTAKQEGISMGQMFDRLVQLHQAAMGAAPGATESKEIAAK